MAIDKKLQIFDDEGNPVDYDILASDVKFQDGKDLPTKLGELEEEIGEGGYTPPQGGIPKGDLEQSVQDTLDSVADKVDKVAGKGLSTEDYTTAEKTKLAGLPTGTQLGDTYPTKTQMQSAISQAAIEAVVGNGDFAMTYDQASDTFNIVRLVPTISVSDDSLSFDSTAKVKTITVSGRNLKADIAIQAPTGWTASLNSLPQVNGTVAETQVTLTYGGNDDSTATGNLVLTAGSVSKSVPLSYSQYGGPTITVEPASLSFEAIGGQTQTKTATVGKFNVTGDVSVAVTGTDASKFSASLNGNTLTVVYTPGSVNSGTHSAIITLSASGAQSKTVAVSGAVLPQSLSVSPASLGFSGSAGTATSAKQVVLTGANLLNDVAVTVPTGFSVTRNGSAVTSIAKADVMASGGVTLDVVAAGTNESGSLAFASGLVSASVSLSWHETEVEEVGTVVTRPHGYTADAQSADIGIKFRITALASTNTHGQVKVVNSIGKCGYYPNELSNNNYMQNGKSINRVHIPATISINDNIYDVTELGAACLGYNTSLQYVEFEKPSNIVEFSQTKDADANGSNVAPFHNASGLKGTDEINGKYSFVVPEGVKTCYLNKIGSVDRIYLPDSATYFNGKANDIDLFDVGSGIASIGANEMLNYGAKKIVLRRTSMVTATVHYGSSGNAFNTWPNDVTIYVPSNLISAYESNSEWSDNLDKVTFAAIEGSPYETSIYNTNN